MRRLAGASADRIASSSLVTRSIFDGATRAARKLFRDSNAVRTPCASADGPRLVFALQPSATQKSSPFAPVKSLLKDHPARPGATPLRQRLNSSQAWVTRSQSGTSTTGPPCEFRRGKLASPEQLEARPAVSGKDPKNFRRTSRLAKNLTKRSIDARVED